MSKLKKKKATLNTAHPLSAFKGLTGTSLLCLYPIPWQLSGVSVPPLAGLVATSLDVAWFILFHIGGQGTSVKQCLELPVLVNPWYCINI